ncbi:MAG: hypothetical protein ICV66_11580, partial [Chitinophagaceae bacterium]|nr:hypothetical protein [Chitinophagaceae bacterium]
MKRFFFAIVFFCVLSAHSQTTPTPDKLWGKLFEDVQLQRIFPDNKTFVDAVPQFAPTIILKKYNQQKSSDTFNLRQLVVANFYLPETPAVTVQQGLPLKEHLENLWDVLTRKADKKVAYSSLLPLPYPYIVPGGRFREIYYWDSYFTMQGLAASNRYDLIESMLDNFKWLIDNFGHIPNGNRNYYLSRSQPPYFAVMVDLLAEKKGKSAYRKYYSALEKEYSFWMKGTSKLTAQPAYRRVVRMPDGSILNRHWDDNNAPRQESFAEDVTTAKEYSNNDNMAFRNLRGSAESGWDFSSRWFEDTLHLITIETTNIVPVDLNCLLYAYENILSKAAKAIGNSAKASYYASQAAKRKRAIIKYCWNNQLKYFFDYDWKEKHTTNKWSIAGTMPLFGRVATSEQALFVQQHVKEKFLKDGGVATTLYHTGQQWDAPNGWAP